MWNRWRSILFSVNCHFSLVTTRNYNTHKTRLSHMCGLVFCSNINKHAWRKTPGPILKCCTSFGITVFCCCYHSLFHLGHHSILFNSGSSVWRLTSVEFVLHWDHLLLCCLQFRLTSVNGIFSLNPLELCIFHWRSLAGEYFLMSSVIVIIIRFRWHGVNTC